MSMIFLSNIDCSDNVRKNKRIHRISAAVTGILLGNFLGNLAFSAGFFVAAAQEDKFSTSALAGTIAAFNSIVSLGGALCSFKNVKDTEAKIDMFSKTSSESEEEKSRN